MTQRGWTVVEAAYKGAGGSATKLGGRTDNELMKAVTGKIISYFDLAKFH